MKLRFIFLFVLLSTSYGFADDSSTFGDIRKIDSSKFASNFHLKGEIFVLDSTGNRLIAQLPEERKWSVGGKSKKIESDWTFKTREIKPVILHHEWILHDDNSITGVIRQFEPGTSKGKIIREQKINLINFAPITWVAQTSDDRQVVVRFTPEMDSYGEAENLDKIQIGGDRNSFQVTDNQGYLWGDGIRFGGTIVGLKSHRGSFIISLYPFKGATEIGIAHGKIIELKMEDNLKVKIQNDTEIIPGEKKARVYGVYIPNFKMSAPNSNWSFGQDKYEGIPKEFLEAKR